MKTRILILALGIFFQFACAQNNPTPMNHFDYEKAWKEVSDYQSKGLPESALKVVNEITRIDGLTRAEKII